MPELSRQIRQFHSVSLLRLLLVRHALLMVTCEVT